MPSDAALAQDLIALFAGAGFARADVAILQPASLFVDLSGEDIRRRLYLTTDAEGAEWCLRPEFTIPLARDQVASATPRERRDASYAGPVFRHRPGESGEFLQAGVESFGRADREAADAESLVLALEACGRAGLASPFVMTGDAGLFADLLSALSLTDAAARRLKRAFATGRLSELVRSPEAETEAAPAYAGLLSAIEGQDPKAARAFVEDVLKIAGIAQVGGRSAGDIADRFLRQAAGRTDARLDDRSRAILSRFLAIEADPDAALATLRRLAGDERIDLSAAFERLEARTGFIAAAGVDPAGLTFRASFGRNLDYYTGFVFEIRDPSRSDLRPVCGGGRYDGLTRALGAPSAIPAVGFSMWLDRLTARGAGA
ncbi:MAG: ATP phosphoribosyltransferase regulatory subunit [Rhizobiales bacterium 65-9]|nr:ATP phosphoribosyltransferase regulatory subunit [Hyphomicrobiales bacterium]OJY34784.1 MAG: ATP phosphoribosyltransferase regulatory subunit [Rhizobiales bacterium 65-9]